jgi:hypothetical protein
MRIVWNRQVLVLELQDRSGRGLHRYSDPEQSRLSAPQFATEDSATTVLLRDLTGSPVVGLSFAADTAPALSVNDTSGNFKIGFSFRETQMDANNALKIITLFSEQLGNPLVHLV